MSKKKKKVQLLYENRGLLLAHFRALLKSIFIIEINFQLLLKYYHKMFINCIMLRIKYSYSSSWIIGFTNRLYIHISTYIQCDSHFFFYAAILTVIYINQNTFMSVWLTRKKKATVKKKLNKLSRNAG